MNGNKWSNDVKMGPRKGGRGAAGGFAGREDLEETRRYRAGHGSGGDDYSMVFDALDDKPRRRSRSPRRDRDRGDRDRERDRDRRHEHERDRGSERRRSRSRDRHERDRRRR